MMKTKLNNLLKQQTVKMNRRMFDVAAAPMFLMIFGAPILLIIAVGAIIGLSYSKLRAISQAKKAEKAAQEQAEDCDQ